MVFEVISLFSGSLFSYIVGIFILLVLLLLVIFLWEKHLKKKIIQPRQTTDSFYLDYLYKLRSSSLKISSKMDILKLVSKQFFNYKFKVKPSLSFLDLVEYFSKIGEKDVAAFCSLMVEKIYSGENLDEDSLDVLIGKLIGIIIKLQRKEKNLESSEIFPINFEKDSKDIFDNEFNSKDIPSKKNNSKDI